MEGQISIPTRANKIAPDVAASLCGRVLSKAAGDGRRYSVSPTKVWFHFIFLRDYPKALDLLINP